VSVLARIRRRLSGPPGPPGPPELPEQAWFDRPDALAEVARLAIDEPGDAEILESWVRDGYVVVEGLIGADAIDAMLAELDGLFSESEPRDLLEFCDLQFGEDGRRETLSHAGLLARPEAERQAAAERSNWRLHSMHHACAAARAISSDPDLERIASLILGLPAAARYSINFRYGSDQPLHEDTAVFHLRTPNLLVGAWIACEDVDETSGPLAYYPGSHRRPLYEEFDDYPNHNFRTATPETASRYNRHVAATAEEFEEHRFLAHKGDVLFWHGGLIHGGGAISDHSRTRRRRRHPRRPLLSPFPLAVRFGPDVRSRMGRKREAGSGGNIDLVALRSVGGHVEAHPSQVPGVVVVHRSGDDMGRPAAGEQA
jgi:ectoine hydroxylase-related dioxygenase (phytanoyl-CoA dioxygenase family)